jgi:acyl carrier protein
MDVEDIQRRVLQLIRGRTSGTEDVDALGQFVLLGEDGVFDSVTALELVLAIEKEFGIVMNDDEVCPENLKTVERLVNFVKSALSRQGQSPSSTSS